MNKRILIAALAFFLASVLSPSVFWGEEEFPVHPSADERGTVEYQRIRFRVETLLDRAEKKIAVGDNRSAISDLEEAVKADPYRSRPAVMLIRLYESEGRLEEARAEADRLIGLFPDYPLVRRLKAVILEKLGRKAEAAAAWKALLPLIAGDREGTETAYRHLLFLLAETGNCAEIERLFGDASDFVPAASAWRTAGECRAGKGEWKAARDDFQRGLFAGPDGEEELLLAAGLLYALKNLGENDAYYRQAAALAESTGDPRYLLEAAEAARWLGETETAARWTRKAATLLPAGERAELLAETEYRLGEYEAVIGHLAPLSDPSARALWLLANALYRTGRPGLALYYFEKIDPAKLSGPDSRRALAAQLAYLYFDQGLFGRALESVNLALVQAGEPAARLRLLRARTLLRRGRTEESLAELEEIDLTDTPAPEASSLRAARAETAGRARLALDEPGEAEEDFSAALGEAADDPAALYDRGIARLRRSDPEGAKADFERLIETSPAPPASVWGNLGVVYGRLGEYCRGIKALLRSLDYYRFDVDTLMELGYQGMKGVENDVALRGFKGAIDLQTAVIPYLPPEPAEKYGEDRLLMKEEYTKVDKTWSLQLYASRTELDETVREPFADTIDGALASQAGALIGWRPPWIGFRDEKTLDVFLRGLANFRKNSYRLDEDSYQGGVGILVKPFRQINYSLSFERLFKIGSDSENNWLWRNMLSLETGERPSREDPFWLWARLYGEVSYYLESTRRWIYYLDGRIGPSFSILHPLTLTVPQAIGVVRYQSNDPDGRGSYYLGGIGANLRLLEGEGSYTVGRWHLDGYAHYTWGRFDTHPAGLEDEDFRGWIFGISFVK